MGSDAPSDLDPFAQALIGFLDNLSGLWKSFDLDRLTHAQEQAIKRLVSAGLVQQRLSIEATAQGRPEVVRMGCRVTGDCIGAIKREALTRGPDWVTPDGVVRFPYNLQIAPSFDARLTTDGEAAKRDLQEKGPLFVLAKIQEPTMIGNLPVPLLLPGQIRVEWSQVVLAAETGSPTAKPAADDPASPVAAKSGTAAAEPEPAPSGKRKRITLEEANIRAQDALKSSKFRTVRKLAAVIGCSPATVGKLPAWRAYQQRKKAKAAAPAPNAIPLTDAILATEGREEALERLRKRQIEEIAADQADDNEADQKQYRRRRKV